MKREVELVTESWNSAISENSGLRDDFVESEMEPKRLDDDGTDVSLQDWQLGLRNYSIERTVSPSRPSRRSVRTRFTPIEPRLDENMHRHSSPERFDTAPTTPKTPRMGTRSSSTSPSSLESSNADSSLGKLEFPISDGHHLHDGVSGIASPGITSGEIDFKDENPDSFRARLGRGSGLRVSFTNELQSSQSPSLSEIHNGSPSRSRSTQISKDCPESAPVLTRRRSVGPREGIISADKPRGSPLPLPEIETLHQSHGASASGDRGSQFRHSSAQVRSLDSIGEGCMYDSSSDFMSGPLASSTLHEFGREDTSVSNLTSPSFLLRCNARRQHDNEEGNASDDEDVKVGMLCGGGLSAHTSGDFVRLLSKLCLSVPLPKHSVSKASQVRGREAVRSDSIPSQVFSWETQDSSMPHQDYVVIGRHNTLKLLCERCSNGSTPSYNVHKPRKIRDHEHHQHFYKTISKTLDRKLRS